jgi:hypothetical protein
MATPTVSLASLSLCRLELTCSQAPPLYLHITSTSKAGLDAAVKKIEEMMKQELPNLVDERRFRRRDQEQVERDEFGRVSLGTNQAKAYHALGNWILT